MAQSQSQSQSPASSEVPASNPFSQQQAGKVETLQLSKCSQAPMTQSQSESQPPASFAIPASNPLSQQQPGQLELHSTSDADLRQNCLLQCMPASSHTGAKWVEDPAMLIHSLHVM